MHSPAKRREIFIGHMASLETSLVRLMKSEPFTFTTVPDDLPVAGVYLFSDGRKHLYVGRTNSMRRRLQQHCRLSSSHNSSPFAFRLARELCNVGKATYKTVGSRKELLLDPDFAAAFLASKTRLAGMKIRAVGESDDIRQAMLEVYVALAVRARYNSFANH